MWLDVGVRECFVHTLKANTVHMQHFQVKPQNPQPVYHDFLVQYPVGFFLLAGCCTFLPFEPSEVHVGVWLFYRGLLVFYGKQHCK